MQKRQSDIHPVRKSGPSADERGKRLRLRKAYEYRCKQHNRRQGQGILLPIVHRNALQAATSDIFRHSHKRQHKVLSAIKQQAKPCKGTIL